MDEACDKYLPKYVEFMWMERFGKTAYDNMICRITERYALATVMVVPLTLAQLICTMVVYASYYMHHCITVVKLL